MSVTFFEPALVRLLNTETGPVGRYVFRKTEVLAEAIARSGVEYYHTAGPLGEQMRNDVTTEMDGSTGVIVITPDPSTSGRKWARLIAKAQDGTWARSPEFIIDQMSIF